MSWHSRLVSSRTLELMGVSADSPDPSGGRYARDAQARLTGMLQEEAAAQAESAFAKSIADPQARTATAMTTAIAVLNGHGVTSVQEAATLLGPARALAALDRAGELNARIVLSMPARPFLEEGVVGEELFTEAMKLRTDLVRPDFVKIFIDGVPMTRTTALLSPYRCHGSEESFHGEMFWTLEDLVVQLQRCAQLGLGLGAKLHATGDASVRRVLDAADQLRAKTGSDIRLQIAHTEFVHPDDVPRFGQLNVAADLAPYIWYPNVIQESIAVQVERSLIDSSWPVRDLVDTGAVVTAGSDWPCTAPTPDPWTGLQTLVTRQNPDKRVPGSLNASQALTLEEAISAFTTKAAKSAGLDDIAGQLTRDYSTDFLVLDRNLFDIDPHEIHKTKVQRTYFAGRLVHERERASAE